MQSLSQRCRCHLSHRFVRSIRQASTSSSASATSTSSLRETEDTPSLSRSPPSPPKSKRKPRFAKLEADGRPEMTLEHFLIRSKVLSLYRSFIRNTRGLGDLASRHETIGWFRDDFHRNRNERDFVKIRSLLASGKRQLKQISNSTMLVGQQGDAFRGTRATGSSE